MNEERKDQVINPSNLLQAKVAKTGGASMAEMVRDAEAGLRELRADYEALVQTDLRKINDAISRAMGSPTCAADAVGEIFAISHDIGGQAASLDYPLLTAIAQSLCRFISAGEPAALKGLEVITAHAGAMETVVAHKVRGEVREDGKKLLDALDAAVEKALTRGGRNG